MNQMTPEEVAWLVGIFDGEGCISINESNGGKQQRVTTKVKMCDFDVILNLQKVTGIQGSLVESVATDVRQASLSWQVAVQEDVVDLLTTMKDFPFLSNRRKLRMEEALIIALDNVARKTAKKALQSERFHIRRERGLSEPVCQTHQNSRFFINKNLSIQCSGCMTDWRNARREQVS